MWFKRSMPFARSRRSRELVVFAVVAGAVATLVMAEPATVYRARAEVLDAKGSAGEVIEAVPPKTTLEVLAHEGKWLRVRTPDGKEGYLAQAFTEKSGGGPDLSAMTGGSNVTPTDTAAAGRGWDPEVEGYVSSNRLNRKGLERMEAARAALRGKALRQFEKEGKLGAPQ